MLTPFKENAVPGCSGWWCSRSAGLSTAASPLSSPEDDGGRGRAGRADAWRRLRLGHGARL